MLFLGPFPLLFHRNTSINNTIIKRDSVCVARLLGQGRIVVSADVVIFRGISYSLAVSRCGVSTVQNPVAIANRYRLQPIAINSKKRSLVCQRYYI